MRLRRLSMAIAASAALGAAAVIYVITNGSSNAKASATGGRELEAVDAQQAAAFKAFRRPETAADRALAANADVRSALAEAQREFGVNLALARNVLSTADSALYVVPGKDTLCLVAVSSDGETLLSCGATADDLRGGDAFSSKNDDGTVTLQGVFPRGTHDVQVVSTDGQVTPVPLSADDGFSVQTAHPMIMRWRSASGHQQTRPVVVAP